MGAPGSGHGGLLREEAGHLGAPLAQCTGAFDPQGPHRSEPLPSSTPTPPRSARREADGENPKERGLGDSTTQASKPSCAPGPCRRHPTRTCPRDEGDTGFHQDPSAWTLRAEGMRAPGRDRDQDS